MMKLAFVFLIAILAVAKGENLRSVTNENEGALEMQEGEMEQGRRQLLNIWSLLFLINPPCPPHKGGCHDNDYEFSCNGSECVDADGTILRSACDDSGCVITLDNGEEVTVAAEADAGEVKSEARSAKSASSWQVVWLAVAAAAAGTAMYAAVLGNRKDLARSSSAAGIVMQRKRNFECMANAVLCEPCGADTVEMEEVSQYKLDDGRMA